MTNAPDVYWFCFDVIGKFSRTYVAKVGIMRWSLAPTETILNDLETGEVKQD